MHKKFIKATLMCIIPLICFGQVNSYEHKKFENKSEIIVNNKNLEDKFENKSEIIFDNKSLEDKFENDFDTYQSFDNSVKPINQFKNLFGVGGFSDQRLKDSSFNLWDTYEKEMSKQIGIQKLNGPDINNTFNESLNSLGK